MIIACPACSTRYAVPESSIGLEGRTVRCAKCRHSWFQEGPDPSEILPEPAPVAPPAPPPVSTPEPTSDSFEQRPSPASEAVTPPQPATPPREQADNIFVEAAIRSPGREESVETDPLTAPKPADLPPLVDRRDSSVYDDTSAVHYADEAPSSFEFAPPFRPRRNWAKLATIGSVAFAIVTLGLTGAVAFGGLPDWVPVPQHEFSGRQPDLQIDFPRKRQDRRRLPDGSEFFSISGTVTNIGSDTRHIPSLLVVLRDERDRIVYEKEVIPSKRRLKPGETITVNEALTEIPKAATAAEIGWKPE